MYSQGLTAWSLQVAMMNRRHEPVGARISEAKNSRKLSRLISRQPWSMTQPRQIVAGSTYLVTRRCSQRQFLARPSALVNSVFAFCFAYAAQKTGVVIHAIACLSNHNHCILTDPDGRLPEFQQELNRLTSKCINASLGRWENLWDSTSYSAVKLDSPADILDKALYVLCNSVAAGLVPRSEQWPGFQTRPDSCLAVGPTVVRRPGIYFDPNGVVPEFVLLNISKPPGFDDLTDREFVATLAEEMELREMDMRRQLIRAGRSFMGAKAILAQSPFDSPLTREARRTMNPRIAAKDKWRRIEAIKRLKRFKVEYAYALSQYLAGIKEVVFPEGTYWMVKFMGATVEAPT